MRQFPAALRFTVNPWRWLVLPRWFARALLLQVFATEGLRGLYRGIEASLLREMSYRLTFGDLCPWHRPYRIQDLGI